MTDTNPITDTSTLLKILEIATGVDLRITEGEDDNGNPSVLLNDGEFELAFDYEDECFNLHRVIEYAGVFDPFSGAAEPPSTDYQELELSYPDRQLAVAKDAVLYVVTAQIETAYQGHGEAQIEIVEGDNE